MKNMTKEQLVEVKLIASFMGLKQSDRLYKDHFTYVGDDIIKAGLPFSNGIMGNCMDNLPFSSDWNWLMAVADKIESLNFEVAIRGITVTIYSTTDKNPYFQPHSVCSTKIESTYKAIVEFINWYNKTN